MEKEDKCTSQTCFVECKKLSDCKRDTTKNNDVVDNWKKLAVERGVLLNEIWKLTQDEEYTPKGILGAICLKMSEKENLF